MEFIENKVFNKDDYSLTGLARAEYDNCIFTDCNFANANLSNIIFTECVFSGCNLSMVTVKNAGLKDVEFNNCKLLGFNFNYCDPFLLQYLLMTVCCSWLPFTVSSLRIQNF